MNRYFLLAALISMQLNCSPGQSKYEEFIGKTYRSLTEFETFNTFNETQRKIIGNFDNVDYVVSHYVKDSTNLIIFEKIVKQPSGKAKYLMIDIVETSRLLENQKIEFGVCRLNEKSDSEIIAIYGSEVEEVKYYSNIIKAWKANRKIGRLEKIDSKGVDCVNTSYGLDNN